MLIYNSRSSLVTQRSIVERDKFHLQHIRKEDVPTSPTDRKPPFSLGSFETQVLQNAMLLSYVSLLSFFVSAQENLQRGGPSGSGRIDGGQCPYDTLYEIDKQMVYSPLSHTGSSPSLMPLYNIPGLYQIVFSKPQERVESSSLPLQL
jgi:hypothetical protein